MKKYSIAAIVFLVSSLLFYPAKAEHIAGQDFTYVLVDSSAGLYHYQVTLTTYADCLNGSPEAIAQDNPAYVAVYNGTTQVAFDSVNYSSADTISSPGGPCIGGLTVAFCSLKRTFVPDFYLPLSATGYVIVYQRCCWNNLLNIADPQDVGTTATCSIPPSGTTTHNNAAVFTNYPAFVIPIDSSLAFDCSATDADGDSLSYALCTPYTGANGFNSKPYPGPPPFSPLTFFTPMSSSDPIMCSAPLAINPVSGLLTGTPNHLGTYLITVCCNEWRAGVLINTVQREFEYIVSDCTLGISTPSASSVTMYPNPASTELTISAPDGISSVTISNLLGQTIYSNQYNTRDVQVNIAYLPSGLYFVKINDAVVRKFVKE